jgi:hypothetical protein
MSEQALEPIDPRDAFSVTPRLDSEGTQSFAASQAALLLAARAGVLGQEAQLAELETEVAEIPFALPELRAVKRSRRVPVAFYEALDTNRPDLALHDESFTWSGNYSDGARRVAALRLKQWIGDQGLVKPDFFAHSHGGTVANLATKQGVEFENLVLLAWPVHNEWLPTFARVGKIYDIRVKFDLVILVDRGGQRFQHPKVTEFRNGWFDHAAAHESAYWNTNGLWDFDS